MNIEDVLIGVLGILGLVAFIKPDLLRPLFGWQERAMGATVAPPKSFAVQYRISGFVLLVLIVLYIVYVR